MGGGGRGAPKATSLFLVPQKNPPTKTGRAPLAGGRVQVMSILVHRVWPRGLVDAALQRLRRRPQHPVRQRERNARVLRKSDAAIQSWRAQPQPAGHGRPKPGQEAGRTHVVLRRLVTLALGRRQLRRLDDLNTRRTAAMPRSHLHVCGTRERERSGGIPPAQQARGCATYTSATRRPSASRPDTPCTC